MIKPTRTVACSSPARPTFRPFSAQRSQRRSWPACWLRLHPSYSDTGESIRRSFVNRCIVCGLLQADLLRQSLSFETETSAWPEPVTGNDFLPRKIHVKSENLRDRPAEEVVNVDHGSRAEWTHIRKSICSFTGGSEAVASTRDQATGTFRCRHELPERWRSSP